MKTRFTTFAVIPAILLASAPALASGPVKIDLPMPPTPAGNAPASVLQGPIAPVAGPPQMLHPGEAVGARWWTAFASPVLDSLVDRALSANADIAVAQATLRQSHELTGAARGVLFPQIDAGYNVSHQRISETLSSPLVNPVDTVFSLHTAQVSLNYTLDVFGGNRARVRSARAAEQAQAARLAGVRNIVAGNLVLAVIQNAALDAQAEAAHNAIDNNRRVLDLLRQRQALGAVGAADVAAQETALANAEGALPPIEQAHAAQQAAIAVLIGVAPGTALPELPMLDTITLPGDLPLALPSDLVAQRPDVAAAAAAMEGAGADVQTAIAARLPSITLGGSIGGMAEKFTDMFASGNPFWALLGGIAAPIFHGGQLKHQQRAAEAALDAAKATYKSVALQAFADVSRSLTALKTDGDALDAAQRGSDAAGKNQRFVQRQLELGAAGTLSVLNASSAAAQARGALISARSARLSDTVGLIVALGGGMFKPANPALASK